MLADGVDGKDKLVSSINKPTIIYNHPRPGRLLPFKTYQTDDTISRPKYWNGYGVDPGNVNKYGKVNWYIYYNSETECYEGYREVWEGTDHCSFQSEDNEPELIPEPTSLFLLLSGFVFYISRKRYG